MCVLCWPSQKGAIQWRPMIHRTAKLVSSDNGDDETPNTHQVGLVPYSADRRGIAVRHNVAVPFLVFRSPVQILRMTITAGLRRCFCDGHHIAPGKCA